MAKLKLSDLPKKVRTEQWIRSEIVHQERLGIHTYCSCDHCGNPSRGGCCAGCWRGVLEELLSNVR